MFTPGQKIFAVLFVVAFIIIMVFSYRKDKSIHLKQYRGTIWVLIGFIVFMAILLTIKFLITQ
ncbi:hypothetical protein E7Z59_06730 [Robertkochia marina]|uniref:Uncharacterized protein n=1 Tax=Robertkochia marina TaxID=1227945 RepID=A0A4S3LZ48_9FLAO|nr:hypothetical protein E7Z59_06730 [Robertkochia marina]TRZ43007.1 hypothetical protein D3A96_11035 [Robertkochia marina]